MTLTTIVVLLLVLSILIIDFTILNMTKRLNLYHELLELLRRSMIIKNEITQIDIKQLIDRIEKLENKKSKKELIDFYLN